jgi:enamine deaminase RidA (YjgF/YER057c/UK114 family)
MSNLREILSMKRYINPEGVYRPGSYTQVIEVSGGRTLYIAGQVAWDASGAVTSADLKGQAAKALDNLRLCLEAAGGSLRDVVKITSYVVNYGPGDRAVLRDALTIAFGTETPPAHTLIGVAALAAPDFLIEIDAFAVMDG